MDNQFPTSTVSLPAPAPDLYGIDFDQTTWMFMGCLGRQGNITRIELHKKPTKEQVTLTSSHLATAQQEGYSVCVSVCNMGEELKLLGMWGSSMSRRVEIALKLKGVEYEFSEEDIFHNKSALLLKYNPVHKKVPVLVHNGKPIAESQVILEYIDETWKHNPILPRDPYDRAMARFWAKFLDEKCVPTLWKSCMGVGLEREKAHEEARELLSTLEGELKGKKFFGGESVGFVDIVANFVGYWVGVLEEAAGVDVLTKDKFPVLCKWAEEFRNCPVIKDNLPPRDKLVAFFKDQRETIASFYKNKA